MLWSLLLAGSCFFAGISGQLGSNLILFFIAHGLLWLCCAGIAETLETHPHSLKIFFALAILARILLFPMDISDDVYRYVWEGLIQQHGFSPYLTAPDHPSLVSLRTDWWPLINHPDKTAIYPPLMLLLFRGLGWLSPANLVFQSVKLTILFADLLTIALLWKLMRQLGSSPYRVAWYAFNPVVLFSFAGEAHLDVFMILGMVATLYAFQKKHFYWMWIFLALAIQSKYMAVVLVPFFLRRDTWRSVWVLPITVFIPFLIFLKEGNLFESLLYFAKELQFNGSLNRIVDMVLPSALSPIFVLLLFATGILLLRLAFTNPLEGCVWAMLLLLLLSPTVHFWYLSWLAPLFVIHPLKSVRFWFLSIVAVYPTLSMFYVSGEWIKFPWITLIEYFPLYILLIGDIRRISCSPTVHPEPFPDPVRTVAVVVPTLNEESHLLSFLQHCQSMTPPPDQLILCDGGSTDQTLEIAENMNCEIVQAERGRGNQIAAGLRNVTRDSVLILHADCIPAPSCIRRVKELLNQTGRSGGALGGRFNSPVRSLKFINFLNRTRAKIFGISFGDQGQFLRISSLKKTGEGFPEQPLMEDVECSLRLKESEHPLYGGDELTLSTRSWDQSNRRKRALLIIDLVARYGILRFLKKEAVDAQQMYDRYYKSH